MPGSGRAGARLGARPSRAWQADIIRLLLLTGCRKSEILILRWQDVDGDPRATPSMRLFVTDTLGNPYVEEEYIPQILVPLGESRRRANEIKRQEKITVVIGNPPYKEKAKNLGGWIESGTKGSKVKALLSHWMPPTDWNVGAHAKHLRNL